MNKKIALLMVALFSTLLVFQPIRFANSGFSPNTCVHYAVIIHGGGAIGEVFVHTSYFVKWGLQNVFNVERENIKYLVTNPPSWLEDDYDDIATLENVRHYIQWLGNQTGYLFIYVVAHGGGYNLTGLEGGRWDGSEGDRIDEGKEHGDRGVDECILLEADKSKYWDDEFYEDLSQKDPNMPLTVLIQTCAAVNGTGNVTCFSGGFIDDLSDVRYRTLISAANETGRSWYYLSSIAEFTYYYMSAFSDYEIVYNGPYTYFDESSPINWTYKSWRGAYEYALLHDPYYLSGTEYQEYPWFDDDGNGLPTYVNDTEVLDFPENGEDLMRWLKCDVNYDGIVDMTDLGIVGIAYGSTPGDPNWNRQADVYPYEDWIVEMSDLGEVARRYGQTT